MEVSLLKTRSRKKRVNFISPAARAELKSVMSTSVAGMANCSVWRMGDAGSNGKQSNSCMHATIGPARTAHRLASVSGRIPHVSSLLVFGWQGHCELPGSWPHCSHFWSAPAAASHSDGWRASQISFCCPCSWCTRSTCPMPCWSRDCLWWTGWSQYEGRWPGQQGEMPALPRSQAAICHTYCCHILPSMASWRVESWQTRPSYKHGLCAHSALARLSWTGSPSNSLHVTILHMSEEASDEVREVRYNTYSSKERTD